jgi:hypothetical protein
VQIEDLNNLDVGIDGLELLEEVIQLIVYGHSLNDEGKFTINFIVLADLFLVDGLQVQSNAEGHYHQNYVGCKLQTLQNDGLCPLTIFI